MREPVRIISGGVGSADDGKRFLSAGSLVFSLADQECVCRCEKFVRIYFLGLGGLELLFIAEGERTEGYCWGATASVCPKGMGGWEMTEISSEHAERPLRIALHSRSDAWDFLICRMCETCNSRARRPWEGRNEPKMVFNTFFPHPLVEVPFSP